MGSYRKLAKRALKTKMSVMVQVFKLEIPTGFYFFSLNLFV